MALRLRRGTNAERLTITPVEGELIYTTDTKSIYMGDGTTVGGIIITGEFSLGDLTEVDLSTPPTVGQVLKWDGSRFVPGNDLEGNSNISSIFDLNDVFALEGFTPDTGDVLQFDGANFISQKIKTIEGADNTIILDTFSNTFTGNFVGDGSQLTNLPGSGTTISSIFDLNDVFALEGFTPDAGDVLQFDGTNFISQKIKTIEGADSTIMLDTFSNTFTGNFVGDASQLTNLPLFNNSVFDLNDVFQVRQLEADDLLVWDGFNFINQQIGDLINLDEISLLNVSIIGDDSSIIVDALTNRVYAFELDTDQVNTTSIHTLKRAGSNGTATHNIEGLEGNAALTLTAHRTGVAAGSGYSNSILLGATGSDGAKNTTALYAAENILYLTQDSTGALNIEAKYITYDSTSGIGKLGIGTFNPSEVLDVVGNVKVSGSIQPGVFVDVLARDTAITSPTNGMMIYLTATHKFQGYANGAWVDLN